MASLTMVCLMIEFLLTLQVKADITTATYTTAASLTNTSNAAATSTTSSCWPMVMCAFWLGCDWYTRPDGCPGCECPNPSCQDLNCPEGEQCILQPPDSCQRKPCVSKAVCSSNETTKTTAASLGTTSTTTARPTTSSCGPMRYRVCASFLGCDYFYRPDGCLDCACPNPSCQDLNCSEVEQCILEPPDSCPPKPCVSKAVCFSNETTNTTAVSLTTTSTTAATSTATSTTAATATTSSCWPMLMCAFWLGCDYFLGSDGCLDCACPHPSCQDLICPDGKQCILKPPDSCREKPCVSKAVCPSDDTTTTLTSSTTVRICSSDDVCVNGCVSVSGPDGCPICSCPPTCEGISCESDEECILQGVECFTTPCFPQPICVPKQISCDGNPKAERCKDENTQHGGCVDRWTYNSSMNACERFCYYGCTPIPANTFKSQKKCMAKCKVRRR